MVVASGRMIANFLPIPNAESLPFYHGIKVSVCVFVVNCSLISSFHVNCYDHLFGRHWGVFSAPRLQLIFFINAYTHIYIL